MTHGTGAGDVVAIKKSDGTKAWENQIPYTWSSPVCVYNQSGEGELIYGAREDMVKAVTDAGYDYIAMDAQLTRFGGIETRDEGMLYAKWLRSHEGEYDGVIFSMPIINAVRSLWKPFAAVSFRMRE